MLTIDFETKSEADLTQVGAWVYSEHPSTEVICVCWGIDNDPIGSWCPGLGDDVTIPWQIRSAVVSGMEIEAHNVAFEYSIWHNILAPRFGWVLPVLTQWRDTMAVACYYALPAALDRLAAALKYEGKDPRGGQLITKYSKLHLKTAKRVIPEEDLRAFVEYCKRDVQIEQSISDELGDLPEQELLYFQNCLEANTTGLFIDAEAIDAASAIVDQVSERLTLEFNRLTGINPTQHAKFLEWLKSQGLMLENLQADYIEEVLEGDGVPQGPCRRALEIRLEINKASTKKLDAMARNRSKDGRARFQTRFHGAVTGRETGTGLQPLNLNRGFEKLPPEVLISDIMQRSPEWLEFVYGDAMQAIAKASRHFIKAEPGSRLLGGDFVSIEAVILACLAGEEWKIEAFRRKEKIYEATADKIYKLPPGTVTKETHPQHRQDGKTCELAFGYQGALGAWLKFDTSGRHSDEKIIEFNRAWRAEHPMITKFWRMLQDAAISAVEVPGSEFGYRQIGFKMVDEWLSMILPNGKRLWYREPRITIGYGPWHQPTVNIDCAMQTCQCDVVPKLSYMAQKEGRWKRVYTYGGKLTENATQAVSREVLMRAIDRAKKAGYTVILSVYDEIVAEVPYGLGSVKHFGDLMKESPGPWADGWPIDVSVEEAERYKK